MGECGFFRAIVAGRAARQQLRGQLVDADCAVGIFVVVRRSAALGQVRATACQIFRCESDLLADLVAHTAQVAKADAIHREQFTRVMDAHAFQDVLGLQAVAQLSHGGERGCGQRDRTKATVGSAVPSLAGMYGLPGREDGAPGAQHLFGVVEPFLVVAL